MKRFLSAALLALLIHGLFFGLVPSPARKTSPPKVRFIDISLASRSPAKTTAAAKPGPPVMKKATPLSHAIQKRERAAPRKRPVKRPERTVNREKLSGKRKAVVKNKSLAAREKKTRPRPPKKKPAPQKMVNKPLKDSLEVKKPPEPVRKTTFASLVREKKAPSPPPTVESQVGTPEAPTESPPSFPDVPLEDEWGGSVETASIAPAKVVREARPNYKSNPPPAYPRRARRRGYEGTVILEVLVDREGRVKDLRVRNTSGHTVLDLAAMNAVKEWIFEPGMVGDKKVDMWVRVPVRFELKGG